MRIRITTAAVLALLATSGAGAQQYATAGGAATGSITISGSSTVRDWSCTVGSFDAEVRTPDTAQPMPSGRERASFVIPVNGIDCRNGTMNNHLRDALRMTIVSEFSYTLESIIQAGKKRMAIAHVPVETNARTRDSRLFDNISSAQRRTSARSSASGTTAFTKPHLSMVAASY